jgi:invasion protein IalB
MNRWCLSLVLGAFLIAGLGLLSARAETNSAARLTQFAPPGSTTEKKPATAQTTPTQQAPAAPAPATGVAKTPPAGPAWAVNCRSTAKQKELECGVSQTLIIKKSGQVLTRVTFRIAADTKKPEVIVQLPLGVLLAAGATFQVDENVPQALSFRTCGKNGCVANSPVTPEVLATLRRGKQLTIGFQDLKEKPITVPLSLNGFAEAYDKMQKPS